MLNKLTKLFDQEIRRKNLEAMKFRARGAWFGVRGMELPDPVFVIGCSRSGTTVTYETIASVPELISFGYELPQFWHRLRGPTEYHWDSEAAYPEDVRPGQRRRAQRYFYERLGSGRVLDKTCINVLRVPYLLELFPKAVFVYIHRDGRDNVSSLMDGWREGGRFALSQFLGKLPETVSIENGEFLDWCFFLPPGWRDYNRAGLADVCAFQWKVANEMALRGKLLVPKDQWIQLRYEDIFNDPEAMFSPVFERLGIEVDAALSRRLATLNARPTSIVSGTPAPAKWKTRNRADVERILPVIEPLMQRLGYSSE